MQHAVARCVELLLIPVRDGCGALVDSCAGRRVEGQGGKDAKPGRRSDAENAKPEDTTHATAASFL